MGYNPLVFFWLAEYKDGKCFAQFDVETGEENLFRDVDQFRLKKFGWYPFPLPFAVFLQGKGHNVLSKDLPSYEIELQPGQRLIVLRRNIFKPFKDGGERYTVYMLGWWKGSQHGPQEKSIMFIKEDGSVVLSDDFQKVM